MRAILSPSAVGQAVGKQIVVVNYERAGRTRVTHSLALKPGRCARDDRKVR